MTQPFAQRTDGSRGNPIPLHQMSEPKLDRDLDDTFPASDPVASEQLATAAPTQPDKGSANRQQQDKNRPDQRSQTGGARQGDQSQEKPDSKPRPRQ